MTPFCGGLKSKLFILASPAWLATTFAFPVSLFLKLLDIFLIHFLATSIDVEHLFSKGQLILSHVHDRMSAGTTHELLCLDNWGTQGLVKMVDLKEVSKLLEVLDDDASEEEDNFDMIL